MRVDCAVLFVDMLMTFFFLDRTRTRFGRKQFKPSRIIPNGQTGNRNMSYSVGLKSLGILMVHIPCLNLSMWKTSNTSTFVRIGGRKSRV